MDRSVQDGWLEHATARLAAAGLRSGAGRSAVLEVLAREGQCLIGAREIAVKLDQGETTHGSPATTYRALDMLSGLGLVHKVVGADGAALYEIAMPDSHHHHFVDEDSGAITPFEDDQLEAAIEALGRRLGVVLTGHDVVLRGRPAGH